MFSWSVSHLVSMGHGIVLFSWSVNVGGTWNCSVKCHLEN